MEDIYTEQELLDMAIDGFILKDRKRAAIFKPNAYHGNYRLYNN